MAGNSERLVIDCNDRVFKEYWNDRIWCRHQLLTMQQAWGSLEDAQAWLESRAGEILQCIPLMSSKRARRKGRRMLQRVNAQLVICTQIAKQFEAKRRFP